MLPRAAASESVPASGEVTGLSETAAAAPETGGAGEGSVVEGALF